MNKEKKLEYEFQDTVGGIAVDSIGNTSSGVSSGGIPFKFPGRIGEVCSFNFEDD